MRRGCKCSRSSRQFRNLGVWQNPKPTRPRRDRVMRGDRQAPGRDALTSNWCATNTSFTRCRYSGSSLRLRDQRRVGNGALAPCPPSFINRIDVGGYASAFALELRRTGRFAHRCFLASPRWRGEVEIRGSEFRVRGPSAHSVPVERAAHPILSPQGAGRGCATPPPRAPRHCEERSDEAQQWIASLRSQ